MIKTNQLKIIDDSNSEGKYLKLLEELLHYRESIKKESPIAYRKFKKLTINESVNILESTLKFQSEVLQSLNSKIEHE